MRDHDFNDTTLWPISAFERLRAGGDSGFARLGGATVLSSTLNADLSVLEQHHRSGDVVHVVAACIRNRESALVLLSLAGFVWPLTLFPQQNLYHLPRSIIEPLRQNSRDLEVIGIEPAGLRPPGHVQHERIADKPGYRLLPPLLWALAQHAPPGRLIGELAGTAAYRITADVDDNGAPGGAMKSSLDRLRVDIASLPDIAAWPGMDMERAVRLLNGAYLQGAVIVLRNHPSARSTQPGAAPAARGLRGWLRGRR